MQASKKGEGHIPSGCQIHPDRLVQAHPCTVSYSWCIMRLSSPIQLSHKTPGYSVENSWLRGDHGFEGYTVTQSFNTPRQPVDEMFASMFIKVIAS